MPRAAPLSTPSPGDPDRKRVLNVLAQRRYRQRKKEKYAMLEKQAKSASSASCESSSPESVSEISSGETRENTYSSGVPLTSVQENILRSEAPATMTTSEVDFNLTALLGPTDLSNCFDFSNDLVPEISHSNYEVYQPAPSLSMDMVMDIPVMKTLKAGALIAQALGCEHLLWDPTSRWTIPTPTLPGLPENMQPTPAQLSIPHHPLFDILPWPQLRTKLICVFALPEHQRPENARDPLALMQVTYDIEDEKDGFRVNGEGREKDDWEIGEAFFKNWWWALDRQIVECSNAWRQRRGQPRLGMKNY
ncbi:uncharacterized protein PV09_07131 [Verruconis gallopava]|uniref:BZIP domain-containing protein n=1 Tax=Verruconis gallopava TaxID=253628 RepID=A0A0D2A4G9_9PEZI|nr:uncharacterized protein PV09_07131 [Verruconis gallopava]KIW01360.1 hypothetical protein PV09_07131 [Verruconis gallopava]